MEQGLRDRERDRLATCSGPYVSSSSPRGDPGGETVGTEAVTDLPPSPPDAARRAATRLARCSLATATKACSTSGTTNSSTGTEASATEAKSEETLSCKRSSSSARSAPDGSGTAELGRPGGGLTARIPSPEAES